MKKLALEHRHSPVPYVSYVVGFVLSIIATVVAYLFVTHHLWPKETLIYVVLSIAVIQLVVQMVFFLHIGRGSHWKLITFSFTVLVVLIVVVGSIWIMDNLNYNMMRMTPHEIEQYMQNNEGL
ncbi:MAG TPA: cytochrome o ubiquinol oxidase subunit IV [Dongiaceae bacterium]|nr:cytochrome o ubiquinol oxidase subunit IV [Dongiaceae bacterium]